MAYYGLPGLPGDSEDPTSRHPAVGAWFLGPRAENFDYLQKIFKVILDGQKDARVNLYPKDQDFITASMKDTDLYKNSLNKLDEALRPIMQMLSEHSIPFWSPRYNGHMNMDSSMPGIIGYLTAMMYNPNNVATEASPVTTMIEHEVGQQLCKMLGFRSLLDKTKHEDSRPMGWGHIACDGSVANLESIWVARNLKFYPLSLRLAITSSKESPNLNHLQNIEPPLEIVLCTGKKKVFLECSTWELLNLAPSAVAGLPEQLYNTYGISTSYLQSVMQPWLIQTVGKDFLEKEYKITLPSQIFVGSTKHYSWPKGAAIAGIGSANVVDVPVDLAARMDPRKLDKMLAKALKEERAIYAVVAIMGSTEQGAVDPLVDIIDLRNKYQALGLSFIVHCDAAWGGYFATMICGPAISSPPDDDSLFVPSMALRPYTQDQLEAYEHADMVTIDPHKSGYIQYPAGGLCYRDGRMRYLVTWTAPVIHSDAGESIGVYGVEGSKPGAPAVATWLSHETIGLNRQGYGTLLGEATYTCVKLYSHWVTMDMNEPELIVVPFNMLPTEQEPNPDPKRITDQRKFILERITNAKNSELLKDKDAWDLLKQLGSDLMINAFACNFKVNGKVNTDIVEANYLNNRIFGRCSVMNTEDDVSKRPLFLTSTLLEQSKYGECLTNFKKRLGLVGDQDVTVLINVTMSPWPTASSFLNEVAEDFRKIAKEELEATKFRDIIQPDGHGFVMQGTDKLYMTHLPMFTMKVHRKQVIITGDLPADILAQYQDLRAKNPDQFFLLGNANPDYLDNLIKDGNSFEAVLDMGFPVEGEPHLLSGFKLENIHAIVVESLEANDLDTSYPNLMPFYLYGTPDQVHIDHVLRAYPNIQLASNNVKLDIDKPLSTKQLYNGVVAVFKTVFENYMQPITAKDHNQVVLSTFSFAPGSIFSIDVYSSYKDIKTSSPIGTGTLTLEQGLYVDSNIINMDEAPATMVKPGKTDDATTLPRAHQPMHFLQNVNAAKRELGVNGIAHMNMPETNVGRASVESKARDQHLVMNGWQTLWNEKKEQAILQGHYFLDKTLIKLDPDRNIRSLVAIEETVCSRTLPFKLQNPKYILLSCS